MKRTFLAALVTLFAAAPVYAQDLPKVYGGVSAGISKAKSACDGLGGLAGVTCEDTSAAFRLFGGYQFHRNFAAELGASFLGEAEATGPGGTVTIRSVATEAVVLGIIPATDRFSVYGKFGIYHASTEAELNTVTRRGTINESNTDLTYGFGVRFELAQKAALRLEWQRYTDVGGGEIGKSDIDVFSVAVILKF